MRLAKRELKERGAGMSWSKAKNIIILVLLAANLLLAAVALPIHRRQVREDDRLIRELDTLFSAQGLSLSTDLLPGQKVLYELELTHGSDAASAAVTALLGDSVLMQTDSGRYLSVYTGPNGSCTFSHTGGFSARLTGVQAASDDLLADAAQRLEAMGFVCESLRDLGTDADGFRRIQAQQSLLGSPIFGTGLTLCYRGRTLESMDGMFYALDGLPVQASETACISAADALVAFLAGRNDLGWVGSQITAIQQGWLETETPSALLSRLTPAWRITTDTAVLYVSGLDGSLTQPPQ